VIYCCKCPQPDTRPGIVFDDEQVCSACYQAELRESVNWGRREEELRVISETVKEKNGDFDCVIGVSGGKDSHFQAFYARDNLGLKPLLVNCAPENFTNVGRANLENLVSHGFDLISIRPNPVVMKALTKKGFFEYGNPVKPSEYPLYAVSWIIANKFDIPLIIQGDNPAETLGIVEDTDTGGNAYSIRKHNTISGDASQWLYEGIDLRDLFFYQFPNELEGIRSIWLSHYVKEWSNTGNTEFAISKGLHGRPNHDPSETGKLNSYCSIDSDIHILNQLLKYYKFGFGFVTDEVCYDIREGRMTREAGIELVRKYDGRLSRKYILEFCDYIGISEYTFWKTVDKFVNKDLFYRDSSRSIWRPGEWVPKFKVGVDYVPRKENRRNYPSPNEVF